MDSTGFNHQDGVIEHELERPLTALEPLPGALNRDRMLFEAGRASAKAGARARFLTLAAATVAVSIGLGLSLFSERSGRRALELAIADLEAQTIFYAHRFHSIGPRRGERLAALQLSCAKPRSVFGRVLRSRP